MAVNQTSYYYFETETPNNILWIENDKYLKGRFLEFRMYHNFTNLFSKLSESTLYKEISKCQ